MSKISCFSTLLQHQPRRQQAWPTSHFMLYALFWVIPRLFSSQTFSRIKTPTFLQPSHSSYLPAYEDGTEHSEMSAYKIRTPRNNPEERTQHSEHDESLKLRSHFTLLDNARVCFQTSICLF